MNALLDQVRTSRFISKFLSFFFAAIASLSCFVFNLPDRGTVKKPEEAVRVMTFNILYGGDGENEWSNRTGIVAETIAKYLPDSFGVQEAHFGWRAALCFLLPEYGSVGVQRDDGKFKGESSAIYYLREKYLVTDSGNFWISETPDEPSKGWDAGCYRICTWAVLRDRETGFEYAHINTHLDNAGVEARKNGVRMILEKAKEFTDAGTPVVCTGDFNIDEGSGLYTQLVSGVLSDTKRLAPDTMSGNTYHGFDAYPVNSDPPIDYVLCSNAFTPLSYKIVTDDYGGRLPSDHFPVYSDMKMTKD